jgi:hypothetical protein
MNVHRPRQSFGKRAAKIFLPVLIAVNVPFVCIQIDALLNPIDLDKAGKWAMDGSWAFDYVLVPVTLVILFIVQWVIMLPVWNRIFINFRYVLFSSLFVGIILSILFGILLGYLVWTNQLGQNEKQAGVDELINSILMMSSFVVAYCFLNIITLYFLDRSYIKLIRSQKTSYKLN